MGLSIFDTGGLSIFGYLQISNDGTKTTIMGVTDNYNRIGDAGQSNHNLNSEDDLMVTGDCEINGTLYIDAVYAFGSYGTVSGNMQFADDTLLSLGTTVDSGFIYETADTDARILIGFIDESADSGNNVPVFLWAEHTAIFNVNLGLFDAITEPMVASLDLDGDSYAYIGHSADDVPRIGTNGTGANGIILTNPKNAATSALSGTQLDVEIDIGGTPYYFTVYPTKAG